ncbi:MAG: bifunctional pyr operon transcriptional regulator/uracil phosphoribosyltransferase PyrR [Dehalococcoidia bacterium]|nr:bifunctional pyr operon transcriptional regulator/uracil phosphoribosyltransferase PyrR [Dehalococcoidia bacterium]
MTTSSSKIIMTPDDVRRALTRVAHEVLERNRGAEGLILAGIQTRGLPLAHRLAKRIQDFEQSLVPVFGIDISLYRDDVRYRTPAPSAGMGVPANVERKRVVLVDDVIFTGRSIRAAMDAVLDLGRPQNIQLAVLVDRGHREVPIRADYVGKNVPTSLKEEVQVHLEETDGKDEVTIFKKGGV